MLRHKTGATNQNDSSCYAGCWMGSWVAVLETAALGRGVGQLVVNGYHAARNQACFWVGPERFCVSPGVAVQDGQVVRISQVGPTPLRLQVAEGSIMPTGVAAERERQLRLEEEPNRQRMYRAALIVGVEMNLLVSVYWRRALRIWIRAPQARWVVWLFRGFWGWSVSPAVPTG